MRRKGQLKARGVAIELVYYSSMMAVLYLICYSNRDFRSQQFRQHLDDTLLQHPNPSNQHTTSDIETKRFDDVSLSTCITNALVILIVVKCVVNTIWCIVREWEILLQQVEFVNLYT